MIWLVFYAGVSIGGIIGVVFMCLLQINKTHKLHDDDEKGWQILRWYAPFFSDGLTIGIVSAIISMLSIKFGCDQAQLAE